MDNKILILGALAIGLYMMSGSGGGEKRFMVPGVGYVPESQLPSMGYVKVGEKWYSQAQVDAAAAQAGVGAGTVSPGTTAWNTIAAILAAAIPLVTTIVNSGGGSNNSSMGMLGINYTCGDAGYWLKVGNDPRAGSDLAHCRWNRR